MRAEDILPNQTDFIEQGGLRLRKGSVAAFLANARILDDPQAAATDQQQAEADLQALLPVLDALGLFEVFEVKPAAARQLVARYLATRPAAA
jgi:hypothetical protein